MSRSPYDPCPSYSTCEFCGNEYDDSGYYGPGDSHHVCKAKVRYWFKTAIRHHNKEAGKLFAEARQEIKAEDRQAELDRLKHRIQYEERRRAEAVSTKNLTNKELMKLKRELAELEKTA